MISNLFISEVEFDLGILAPTFHSLTKFAIGLTIFQFVYYLIFAIWKIVYAPHFYYTDIMSSEGDRGGWAALWFSLSVIAMIVLYGVILFNLKLNLVEMDFLGQISFQKMKKEFMDIRETAVNGYRKVIQNDSEIDTSTFST